MIEEFRKTMETTKYILLGRELYVVLQSAALSSHNDMGFRI